MNACMYVCYNVCMYVCAPIGALIGALRGVGESLILNMHILRMYVYIDAPIILGVLNMYECMHVCMYYVCMYACTPIGALIRRADAVARHIRVWCRCVPS